MGMATPGEHGAMGMATPGEASRERWGGLGGLLFVVGMLVIFFVGPEPPEDATSEQLAAFYSGNEAATTWIPFLAILVSALGFLWFLGTLRSRLRRAEGGEGRVSWMGTVAGAGSLFLLLSAGAVFIALAFSAIDSGNPNFRLDVSAHTLVEGAGFGFFLFHLILGAALAAATSVVSIRTRAFPAWFGWTGLVLALLALITSILFFVGLLAYWLWVAIASVLLLMGTAPGRLRPAAT